MMEWQPIDTAPEPVMGKGEEKQYRVRVLIQDEDDNVFEGYARFDRRELLDGEHVYMLRWYTTNHAHCRPKYWMPLPEAKRSPTATEPEGK